MNAALPPPMRGDHRSTLLAVAAVLFLIAATLVLAVSLGGQAGLW